MSHIETRVGLTNVLKRYAYHCFLTHGLGQHALPLNEIYDEVEICELYPWMANPENTNEYGGGISVSFYKNSEKVRFVEFAVRFTGGGGKDVIRRIK